jgi:membrane associated rhomboid family serine protease
MHDTPVVFTLLILCSLVFVAQLGGGNGLVHWFALWPLGMLQAESLEASQFHPWQLFTYAFLHGGVLHLALNLYALWLFGSALERRWGSYYFASFFVACVVGAGLVHLTVAERLLQQGELAYPVIGASGGVFGVLLGFGLRYPNVQLLLLIPPMPVKAKWFVIGYGAIELLAGMSGSNTGIAHFAHLGGMLTGYLLLRGGGSRFF